MVRVPIKNVLMKNVDIYYSDLFVKINAPSIKFFLALDLAHEIADEDPKNRC